MSEVKRFALPDAGEGLTDAEIVSWKVRPGDRVTVNQMIVEIETAKSLVELPCPYAGVVTELLVAEGQTVDVGTPIIAVDTDPDRPEVAAPPAAAPQAAGPVGVPAPAPVVPLQPVEPVAVSLAGSIEPILEPVVEPVGRTALLVGYGPRESPVTRRPRRRAEPVTDQPVPPAQASRTERPLAKPPVRKLARDLGLDLASVPATGPNGVVTRQDVEQAAADPAAAGIPVGKPVAVPDLTVTISPQPATDRETRLPIRGVRRATAQAMVASAFTAPHVTEWLSVDVTRTMKLVRRLRLRPEFAEVKVTPLLVVARAVVLAARRHPAVNSAWDEAAQQIVLRQYVNLGIAAATPRGLLVPNIKDADGKSLVGLAEALGALAQTARDGRTPPADLTGGTITITNVGVFGVDGGTPILNPGEAAIVAVGQVRSLPWVHRGRVRPRSVVQLSLSFDHRLVDGEQGSRFLADVGAALERPEIMLSW